MQVWHSASNSHVWREKPPQGIEFDLDVAPALECLIDKYPAYLKIGDDWEVWGLSGLSLSIAEKREEQLMLCRELSITDLMTRNNFLQFSLHTTHAYCYDNLPFEHWRGRLQSYASTPSVASRGWSSFLYASDLNSQQTLSSSTGAAPVQALRLQYNRCSLLT